MEAVSENKKGRPRVFDQSEMHSLYDNERTIDILTDRSLINMKYREIGMDAFWNVLNPEVDNENEIMTDLFGIFWNKRQGILEQIGRIIKSELFTEIEIEDLIKRSAKLAKDGYKSREIEKYLRDERLKRKRG